MTGLVIQSDGGNEFKDRFHNELTRRKIKHYYGVPGKPASQSMVERLNQTIKLKLQRGGKRKRNEGGNEDEGENEGEEWTEGEFLKTCVETGARFCLWPLSLFYV